MKLRLLRVSENDNIFLANRVLRKTKSDLHPMLLAERYASIIGTCSISDYKCNITKIFTLYNRLSYITFSFYLNDLVIVSVGILRIFAV